MLAPPDVNRISIRLDALSKRFEGRGRGEVTAVQNVTLDVPAGAFVVLLGPSGCGKTTTLRMIAGFETPTSGRIFFGESDVTDTLASRRNIGFVFQSYALFPHLTVYENVAYGLRVRRWPERDLDQAVRDVLGLVELPGYERRFPHQLSGGEQQRVALARAVVIRPQVLLFDEPLSNLDARLRVQMRGEIRRLQAALSITTIYVTHDQEEAMAVADRIAVMSRGRVVQIGTAEDLYARPATRFVAEFIGRVNVVTALVVGAGIVEVGGQRFGVEATVPAPEGSRVAVAVRPETIELGPPTRDGNSAEVLERVFLGEKVDYRVRWGSERLLVCAYDPIRRGAFAPGDRVAVRFPERGARVLDDEPAP